MKEHVIALLKARGVTPEQIAQIAYSLQKPYYSCLELEQALAAVDSVLSKREVQHTLLTGIALDVLAEVGQLPEPLLGIVQRDEPLFGVDETLALGITNLYGTIGYTSFGYLDKTKPGIIGMLDGRRGGKVNTFLDDLIAGVAAAASAKLAHKLCI